MYANEIYPILHNAYLMKIHAPLLNIDIATAYMPMEENQFLHASAPVRVLLAILAGLKWMTISKGDAKLYKKRNALLAILLYDGLGGLIVGWYLGTFSGKVAAYR